MVSGITPGRVLVVAAFFIVAYFSISIADNAIRSYQMEQQQLQLQRDVAKLEGKRDRLQALRRYMETDEFVERAARAEGWARPGDTVVIVNAPRPTATPATGPARPWWERYFGEGTP